MSSEETLIKAFRQLGPNAQEMLVTQALTLEEGHRRYNSDFDSGRLDWVFEARREFEDSIHYTLRLLQTQGDSPLARAAYHIAMAGVWVMRSLGKGQQ